MPHGGHFPALEQPQLWLDDVRAFFHDHGRSHRPFDANKSRFKK
jgi:hypothetical protein